MEGEEVAGAAGGHGLKSARRVAVFKLWRIVIAKSRDKRTGRRLGSRKRLTAKNSVAQHRPSSTSRAGNQRGSEGFTERVDSSSYSRYRSVRVIGRWSDPLLIPERTGRISHYSTLRRRSLDSMKWSMRALVYVVLPLVLRQLDEKCVSI